MCRKTALLVALSLCAGMLTGCGSYETKESTLYIGKDGSVVATSVEDFDPEEYDADELTEYVSSAIANYTDQNGTKSVKLKSLKFNKRKGKAVLIMEYASVDDYNAFNGSSLFVGTVGEAKEAGYSFEGEFVSVSKGKAESCSADAFKSFDHYYVVITNEITDLDLYKTISYASEENVVSVKNKKAVVSEGADILETSSAEIDTSSEEGTETTDIQIVYSSSSASDGSVSEDELLQSASADTEEKSLFDFSSDEEEGSLIYMICK